MSAATSGHDAISWDGFARVGIVLILLLGATSRILAPFLPGNRDR